MKNYENNNVQSIQRAFDILELIADSTSPIPLKEIAQKTGLPKPTVYRLLDNLERRGYIHTNNDGKYWLGLRFLNFGRKVDENLEIKQIARPYITSLNNLTEETVHLGILQNHKVVYVDTIESPLPIRLVARIGGTNSVHCTSLGKALLINHSDEKIVDILREQGMELRTDRTITSPMAFLREMALVRSRGFALDEQESSRECFCISSPIYDQNDRVVAAISISGPASRFEKQYAVSEVAPHLKSITAQISKSLGSPCRMLGKASETD